MSTNRPVGLLILDGWGIREKESGNAIAQADTPNYDRWLRECERSILDASGAAVGLPTGQMGNSEVGHLNLGAGRIVYQDISRIDNAIEDGSLAENNVLQSALAAVKRNGSALHFLGLQSDGGVHSHEDHVVELLKIANAARIEPILHVITDGRDTPPNSGQDFVANLEAHLASDCQGEIATVIGRYYAMDRDKRWERTTLAYNAIARRTVVDGQGRHAPTASDAITQAYAEGETDEFVLPTLIDLPSGRSAAIKPGDTVLCFNFRADRMRQIVRMLTDSKLDGYLLEAPITPLTVVTMTRYEEDLPAAVLFDKDSVVKPLAEVISEHNLAQLHAAETEKYAHVTYFFNGGAEDPFPNEEHMMVASPKVATYDLQPEMSAHELTDKIIERIEQSNDAFILVNFANPDMVGHTGDLEAAKKAVAATDGCAGRIVAALNKKGGVALVTADHGNSERMVDEITGNPHTYHTTSPVSFIVIGNGYFQLRPRGILADVAPTVLDLLALPKPEVMTGQSLIEGSRG